MATSGTLPAYVGQALMRLKQTEMEHLEALPDKVKRELADGSLSGFDKEKHHIRSYGDVIFTLAGAKPCALLAHGIGPFFAKGFAKSCLVPLMDELKLEQEGFQLVEIKHQLLTSNPIHPGFKGGWVFANTRHKAYPLVKETFLVPHRGPVDEGQIGAALGYPLPSGDATIGYIDLTESQELNVCCVPVLEYFCPSYAGFKKVLLHFTAYQDAWAKLGRTLTIDTSGHPRLGQMMSAMQRGSGAGR